MATPSMACRMAWSLCVCVCVCVCVCGGGAGCVMSLGASREGWVEHRTQGKDKTNKHHKPL